MNKPNPLLLALGAALLQPAFHARAQSSDDTPAAPGAGISEISDDELSTMRGRYTVGDNTVAWFGVSMISTWQTATGQILESTMKVAMDFSHGGSTPKVTFTPTVNITRADVPELQSAAAQVASAVAAPTTATASTASATTSTAASTTTTTAQAPAADATPAVASTAQASSEPQRSVDASGLQNVSGLVQSVQVAGDGNAATNATRLTVREGSAPQDTAATTPAATTSVTDGAATASASYANGTAGVLLLIAGQGQVQQWIRNGSVGQSIQLTGDAQQISNRLQLDLVRQSVSNNLPLNQNVAQAITLARGIGPGTGQ